MASDQAVARPQLGTVYEDTSWLTVETIDSYFRPFGESAERQELVRGFAEAQRNRDQLMAVAPRLKDLKVPTQVIWG